MTHKKTIWFALSLLLLISTACRQAPQAPDPSMTAVGSSQTSSDSADWISQDQLARANSLGLNERSSTMTDAASGMGETLENLFQPIYFDFNQSFLRPADRPILQEVASYLEENPSTQLLIEGHCDWRGTTEYNMALGDRRANSVRQYIEQLGIDSARIETVSKGDLEAITEGSDLEMQQDRRADLIVVL